MVRQRAQQVAVKPEGGLVTDRDLQLERALRQELLDLLPGSCVCGEEEGLAGGSMSRWTWYLDPLDGTTNYVHGWPHSAISVALCEGGEELLGVTHDPYLGETFYAIRGQGAFLGNQRLQVSACQDMSRALFTTGFAPEPASQWETMRRVHLASHGVRVSACASLDMAYVAAGRCEGYWEVDLKPWDVAAGLLLVREAGGVCCDLKGQPAHRRSADFLITTSRLQGPLLEMLAG
jgi:myo-inositol-1(or 4)-monophosphatase